MFFCIQKELGASVMDAVDRCRHAFMKKSTGLMDKEIEAFWIYHDDFYSYTTRLEEYRDTLQDTERKRKEYVEAEMFRFDRKVWMAAEDKQWKWSSLFCAFSTSPEPACMTRPFQHTEEEFQILLAWMAEEGKNTKIRNEPPVIARAFKFFMRSEYGGRVPLLCHVQRLTADVLFARTK